MATNGDPADRTKPEPGASAFQPPSFAEFEKARAALAPAFAFGLQQALESPARWAELSRAFFAMTGKGETRPSAEPFLTAIFGAPGLRDAVLGQASAMTGIAAPVLAEIMPKLAAAGVETMMRGAMTGLVAGRPNGMPGDDLGRTAAEMMRRGANAVEALSRPSETGRAPAAANPMSPTYFFDAFGDAMRTTWGAAPAAPQVFPAGAGPFPALPHLMPFTAMFDAFAKGMGSAAGSAMPPSTARPSAGATAGPDPGLVEAFSRSGQRLQDQYVREMTALFQRFAPPAAKAES